MGKWLPALLCLLLSANLLSGCGYRQIQADDEQVLAAASEYLALSRRRVDQVPGLIQVVQTRAPNERDALSQLARARGAVVEHMPAAPDALGEPDVLKGVAAENTDLSRAVERLLSISENYPALKADAGFRDIQAQLEEAGERIGAAQTRYADAVKAYNAEIGALPNSLTAILMGAKSRGELR